ncbi:MAG: aminopeptidase P family protein, partial [Lentisphaerae bacterium]
MPHTHVPRLIYDSAETSADLRYITQVLTPDPCLWFCIRNQAYLIVSPLEYSRIKRSIQDAPVATTVMSTEEFTGSSHRNGPHHLIHAVSKRFKVFCWQVPFNFPLGLAARLKRDGIHVRPKHDTPFFPERILKTEREIEYIQAAQKMAEAGLAAAIDVLRQAQIDDGNNRILWDDDVLTSERLRAVIDRTVWDLGGLPLHTIVAGGKQSADPHEMGHGPLPPHAPIVIDIFPRDRSTGYFGDLTRTVVKGEASPIVKQAFQAVREARDSAIQRLKPGVNAKAIHEHVKAVLSTHGFTTELASDPPRGFIHGTGHGVGLEIHEAPRVSSI